MAPQALFEIERGLQHRDELVAGLAQTVAQDRRAHGILVDDDDAEIFVRHDGPEAVYRRH